MSDMLTPAERAARVLDRCPARHMAPATRLVVMSFLIDEIREAVDVALANPEAWQRYRAAHPAAAAEVRDGSAWAALVAKVHRQPLPFAEPPMSQVEADALACAGSLPGDVAGIAV